MIQNEGVVHPSGRPRGSVADGSDGLVRARQVLAGGRRHVIERLARAWQ